MKFVESQHPKVKELINNLKEKQESHLFLEYIIGLLSSEFKNSLSLIQNDTFFNFDAEYLSRPQKMQPFNCLNISALQNKLCPCSGHPVTK